MNHVAVPHSRGEYVHGEVHTNGIESLWSMLKRGITGTYHHISAKHTHRYAAESFGRHNDRPKDTADQVTALIRGMGPVDHGTGHYFTRTQGSQL